MSCFCTSKNSRFVSSRVCSLLMDCFWNVCCKWKLLFIDLLFLRWCTSNVLCGLWLLTVESQVPGMFSAIVSQDSAAKRDYGDSAQPAWPSYLFLPQRYSQAQKIKQAFKQDKILKPSRHHCPTTDLLRPGRKRQLCPCFHCSAIEWIVPYPPARPRCLGRAPESHAARHAGKTVL